MVDYGGSRACYARSQFHKAHTMVQRGSAEALQGFVRRRLNVLHVKFNATRARAYGCEALSFFKNFHAARLLLHQEAACENLWICDRADCDQIVGDSFRFVSFQLGKLARSRKRERTKPIASWWVKVCRSTIQNIF